MSVPVPILYDTWSVVELKVPCGYQLVLELNIECHTMKRSHNACWKPCPALNQDNNISISRTVVWYVKYATKFSSYA